MTLPPLTGERGADAVSAETTETSSADRPSPSATIVREARSCPDVDHAGDGGDPPVRLEPADGRRRLAAAGPRAHRQPDALPFRERRPAAPERVVGEPGEALVEADPAPRRPIGHLVVGGDRVPPPELDRVEPEPTGQLVEDLLERERRLGRARGAVGARSDPVRLDAVGDDLVGVPAVRPDGQDRGDALDAALGEAAGLERQARRRTAQPAVAGRAGRTSRIAAGAGLVIRKSSRRVSSTRTGRRSRSVAAAASGSAMSSLPPNPPPRSRRSRGRRRSAARTGATARSASRTCPASRWSGAGRRRVELGHRDLRLDVALVDPAGREPALDHRRR